MYMKKLPNSEKYHFSSERRKFRFIIWRIALRNQMNSAKHMSNRIMTDMLLNNQNEQSHQPEMHDPHSPHPAISSLNRNQIQITWLQITYVYFDWQLMIRNIKHNQTIWELVNINKKRKKININLKCVSDCNRPFHRRLNRTQRLFFVRSNKAKYWKQSFEGDSLTSSSVLSSFNVCKYGYTTKRTLLSHFLPLTQQCCLWWNYPHLIVTHIFLILN